VCIQAQEFRKHKETYTKFVSPFIKLFEDDVSRAESMSFQMKCDGMTVNDVWVGEWSI
jgi:hypothetical protein